MIGAFHCSTYLLCTCDRAQDAFTNILVPIVLTKPNPYFYGSTSVDFEGCKPPPRTSTEVHVPYSNFRRRPTKLSPTISVINPPPKGSYPKYLHTKCIPGY